MYYPHILHNMYLEIEWARMWVGRARCKAVGLLLSAGK